LIVIDQVDRNLLYLVGFIAGGRVTVDPCLPLRKRIIQRLQGVIVSISIV